MTGIAFVTNVCNCVSIAISVFVLWRNRQINRRLDRLILARERR